MRKGLIIIVMYGLVLSLASNCGQAPPGDYYIQPVDFTMVEVHDAFWSPRMEINREITIPSAFQKCE